MLGKGTVCLCVAGPGPGSTMPTADSAVTRGAFGRGGQWFDAPPICAPVRPRQTERDGADRYAVQWTLQGDGERKAVPLW
jgi:hypothetical protein